MYLVHRTIEGQVFFARALSGVLSWLPDPNQATKCAHESTASILAEQIGGEIVDVSGAACYVA